MPKPVVIVDEEGNVLPADDPHRFFEASWMHKYKGKLGGQHKIPRLSNSRKNIDEMLMMNK